LEVPVVFKGQEDGVGKDGPQLPLWYLLLTLCG
jgi:hypothetical protein